MSELDELKKFMEEKGEDLLGKEGMEQMQSDQDWLENNFSKYIQMDLIASILAIALGHDTLNITIGSFINGLNAYRQFMIEKGVDVLALEGRV